MNNLILFITLISISNIGIAQVWETDSNWNQEYKEDFKLWVKTQVKTDMFSNKDSPYYGIKADCADVTYALRAIYSFENKLPYKVKNPIYRKTHKFEYWSNDIEKFDHYRIGTPRLIAFVNFLGASLGTETLHAYDSYPVKLSSISSGDIHMYKKKTKSGFLRHAYNILNITETGNFQLIWSNQQRKKEGKPMKYAEWSKLRVRPYKYKWGFRRVNFPSDYLINASSRDDYSMNQFDLAKQMDEKEFFNNIKKLLKVRDENPNTVLSRQLKNLCDQARERVDIIKNSEAYRLKTRGKCMNYTDYDNYSTPSRDGGFLELYNRLKDTFHTYLDEGESNQISQNLMIDIESIISSSKADTMRCPIIYKQGAQIITLKNIYQGLKNKSISNHPNDNIDRRWGVKVGSKTTCKIWY